MEAKYRTKDVENKTGIPKNVIRKYSATLEQYGYPIEKSATGERAFRLEDIKLLKTIHDSASELDKDIIEVIADLVHEMNHPTPAPVLTSAKSSKAISPLAAADTQDVSVTIREQNKKFEEFMNKLDNLAQLNEAIIHQNSTLISQNRQKDEKLDDLLHHVYIKESKQEEKLSELMTHVQKKESRQDNKLHDLMVHMQKKEVKQEENLNKLMHHISQKEFKQELKMNEFMHHVSETGARQEEKMSELAYTVKRREASRDEQLMRLIREMQETKQMIAAARENSLLKGLKSLFLREKPQKADSH
ncbi:DUF3967 domain-containing protein [Bacillus sp. 165]|uniref:DUF3967 domain-containing protein n=1 Tax=Bacillus sp. 165 TaxID=1529117 RepID=UPI001ADC73F8|nr:DUF3967 domain-containing protein [Bacillus sp. 165]MBO9130376.1 DUF3967 domain-containing protein [Bacillus sp. 165]